MIKQHDPYSAFIDICVHLAISIGIGAVVHMTKASVVWMVIGHTRDYKAALC